MNTNHKLVIAGTITLVAAPALLVLGRKISKRVSTMRTTKTEASTETI